MWLIGDPGAPARGTSDPDVLAWCDEYGFMLLTNNRRTTPVHLREHLTAGRHIPGILMLPEHSSLGDLIDALSLILTASTSDEYLDRLIYLPIGR